MKRHKRPANTRSATTLVRIALTVQIRDENDRVISIDTGPQTSVAWLTTRALIALDDPRDASQCRLLRHGQTLAPRRSLTANHVQPGDTLDLVPAQAAPRQRRFPALHRLLRTRHQRG